MFTNFKKFFNIENDTPIDYTLDPLTNFRNIFAGMSLNNGLLKILKKEDVHTWKNDIMLAFPKFVNKFEPFAYDWLGSFYCIKLSNVNKPGILIFNIGYNRCLLVPCDFLEFIEKEIPNNVNTALVSSGYDKWLEYRPALKYDECVGFIKPMFLDGSDTLKNTDVYDLKQYWGAITQLLEDRPYNEFLREHYEFFLGKSYTEIKREKSLMGRTKPDFSILKFSPSDELGMWRYATYGMSTFENEKPVELYMLSSLEHDFIEELLTWVAYYHQHERELFVDDIVYLGQPWYEGSKCDYALVCMPYADGPEFKECGDAHCLWLLPITKREYEYKEKYGIMALERKFAECSINFLNHERDSSV